MDARQKALRDARREKLADRQAARAEKFKEWRQARTLSRAQEKAEEPVRPVDVARAQATQAAASMPPVPVPRPGSALVKSSSGLDLPLPQSIIDQLVNHQQAALEALEEQRRQVVEPDGPVEEVDPGPEPVPDRFAGMRKSEIPPLKLLGDLLAFLDRNKIELAPVGSAVLMLGIARMIHKDHVPTAAVALADVAAAAVMWVWPRRWRSAEAVRLARVVTVCAGVYLTLSTVLSPGETVMVGALLAGTAAGAFYWLRTWSPRYSALMRRAPWLTSRVPWLAPPSAALEPVVEEFEPVEEVPEPEPEPELDSELVLLEEWRARWAWLLTLKKMQKLKGCIVARVVEHAEMHWTLTIQLIPGEQTPQDLLSPEIEQVIAGGLRVLFDRPLPTNAVRSFGDRKDGTVVHITVRVQDPLRRPIAWAEVAEHAPSTIRQPLVLGLWEDYSPALVNILYKNVLFGGSIGAGKSNGIATLLSAIAGCEDAMVWFIDLKGGIAAQPWLPIIDWLAIDLEGAGWMLRALKLVQKVRDSEVEFAGDKIKPTRELPALILVIDELAELIGDRSDKRDEYGKLFESIVSLGRALAITVIGATQFCSLASLYTNTARNQFKVNIAMGARDQEAGTFLLGKDAWGKLDVSELDLPGTFFFREARANPLTGRFPLMPDMAELVEDGNAEWWEPHPIAARYAANRPTLESITQYRLENLIGDPYTKRWDLLTGRVAKARARQLQAARAREDALPGGGVLTLERGEAPADREGVQEGAQEGAFEGVREPTYTVAVPGSGGGDDEGREGPAEAAERIRKELEAVSGGVVITKELAAELAALAQPFDGDRIMADKVAYFGELLANADERDGIKNELIQSQVGVGHDWVWVRVKRLVELGVVRRVSKGYYAPVPGRDVRAAVQRVEEEIKAARAEARRLVAAGGK